MIEVALKSENDFDEWRAKARRLLRAGVPVEAISWRGPGSQSLSLFHAEEISEKNISVRIPQSFLNDARVALCHRDPQRFARLYKILTRLQADRRFLLNHADEDTAWLYHVLKNVRRDMHKMKAFVRFRKIATDDERESFVAWFEPTHRIVEQTAPFFMRRFTGMNWTILTPDRSAMWDGATLSFGAGARKCDAPTFDCVEDQWKAYFASIFNPSRVKINAMTSEMPKRYWKNLPEAELIPNLLAHAAKRESSMRNDSVSSPNLLAARASHFLPVKSESPPLNSIASLNTAISSCTRCQLCHHATQAVAGEGPSNADLMIVGEQPGDEEDLAGKPFIGPAGRVLDSAFNKAEIDRDTVYLTNAVKHFRFKPRGKRRIHQRPRVGEIEHCKWWINNEIRLIQPKVVIALGATAIRSLLAKPLTVSQARNQVFQHESSTTVLSTFHPSFFLRAQNQNDVREKYRSFVSDLSAARKASVEV